MTPSSRPITRSFTRFAIASCILATALSLRAAPWRQISTQRLVLVPVVHAQSAAPAMDAKPSMPGMSKPAGTPSTSLTITVAGKATTFSVADLSALPQTSVKVHNDHTKADESYSGVSLSELLAKSGFTPGQSNHRIMLRSYITVQGTDKYWVLYSLTEIEPSQHNGDVIVATSLDGKGLGPDGALKLISTEDKKPQRWVRNLSAISLKSAE